MFNSTNALVEKVERLEKDLRYAKLEAEDAKSRRESDQKAFKEKEYEIGRTHKVTVDGLNDKIASLEKQLKEAISDYEKDIERIENEASERVFAAETKRDVKEEEAVRELRESFSIQSAEAIRNHALEVAKLSKESNAALVRAALAEGKLETIVVANESLEAQLESYREFVSTVLAHLPNVDLSKLNMQVNIPVSKGDVTVVK
jgi:seryl-tRNA synthetase